MQNKLKNELQNVISGKSEVRYGAIIQSVAGYLKKGSPASSEIAQIKHYKKQEEQRLEAFISENSLWVNNLDFTQYVSAGAEQKVYLKDTEHVLKLNDAIYYQSWQDYFYNLLLHNYFFPDTAYQFLGFFKENDILYGVVQQAYVAISGKTYLEKVKIFLTQNGFINTRNNDYFNHDLGIIIEDLHDENVLTRNDVLYFIDTVFYITDNFWTP